MRRPVLLASCGAALSVLLLAGCSSEAPAAPTSSIETPFVGQEFALSGDLGTDGARPVELQVQNRRQGWDTVAKGRSTADGSYELTTSSDTEEPRYRVLAPESGEEAAVTTASVVVPVSEDKVRLSVVRVEATGDRLQASGKAKPKVDGRAFQLEVKDGSGWKKVGEPGASDAQGDIEIPFRGDGTKTYRLVGEPVEGTKEVVSRALRFEQGPKELGANVMYVTTDNGRTPTEKGVPEKGKAVLTSGGKITALLDVDKFNVRGNSTADKPKSPYRIDFDRKESPFNLPEDKDWVLLANYVDHTLVRNMVAWTIGTELDGMAWTPKSVFTELYVNGSYRGSYQLVESIKIDKDRVDISKKHGVLIEVDPHWEDDGVPGFKGDHVLEYAFKDPDERKVLPNGDEDPEGMTDEKLEQMRDKVLDFEKVLYGPDFKDPDKGWRKYLDVDSAVDYYLVKEFTKENDGDFHRSTYFYTPDYRAEKGAKLYLGPAWDFDRSAGAKPPPNTTDSGTTVALPSGWWLRGNGSPNHRSTKTHWYVQLFKDPSFEQAVKDRWVEKRALFQQIAERGATDAVASMGPAGRNDFDRWDGYTDRYEAYSESYQGEVDYVQKWYRDRFAWMDERLSK